jgi:hypothetical protein
VVMAPALMMMGFFAWPSMRVRRTSDAT